MDKPVHIRRCHICGGVSEVEEGRVASCSHCGKALAPFYYFDDMSLPAPSENEVRHIFAEDEYQPIYGLSVFWESY